MSFSYAKSLVFLEQSSTENKVVIFCQDQSRSNMRILSSENDKKVITL